MTERTGQGGGRTQGGYIRAKNGLYYRPGQPNKFYKKVGNSFKPVQTGNIRLKVKPTTSSTPIGKAVRQVGRVGGVVNLALEKLRGSEQRRQMRAAGKPGRAALHGALDSAFPASAIPSLYDTAKNLKAAARSALNSSNKTGAGGGQGNRGRNQSTSSTNTTRNWTKAHGRLSDKPTSGDPNTWKNKPTESAGGSNQTENTNTPAPAPQKPTAKQAQKADFNKTYQEARRKALKIKDAQKRKIALEGVAQMGMEFHKKYYNKK